METTAISEKSSLEVPTIKKSHPVLEEQAFFLLVIRYLTIAFIFDKKCH